MVLFAVPPRLALVLAFLLGACTTAAVSSVASEPPAAAPAAGAPAPLVLAADAAERRRSPNGKGEVRLLARGQAAFLGLLQMAPGAAVPEHRDPTEEYLYILEGGGDLKIDDAPYAIGPGSVVFMPADAKVSFQNGDAPLVALQVFAGPGPAAKYDAWTPVTP